MALAGAVSLDAADGIHIPGKVTASDTKIDRCYLQH